MPRLRLAALAVLIAGAAVLAAPAANNKEDKGADFYKEKIAPILNDQCLKCHGGAKTRNGVDVSDHAHLLKRADNGFPVVPGKPEQSLIIRVIRYDGKIVMPPKARLSDQEIKDLTEWVKRGAPGPKD